MVAMKVMPWLIYLLGSNDMVGRIDMFPTATMYSKCASAYLAQVRIELANAALLEVKHLDRGPIEPDIRLISTIAQTG
jgi:hypothetical protein